jgi:O-antigen/teichoic acid export membrane protein
MHQADRYLLRFFLNLSQVGIYSLAYMIGQAVNAFVLQPFWLIWQVEVYEISEQPTAKKIYVLVFQYFIYGLMLIMLGVAFFARPLLQLMAAPAYAEAANLIPIVCLAYVFFSLHAHFSIPALLAKQSSSTLPASFIAAGTNIGVNLLIIPLWGTTGAAWTSVLTFATFSFIGLWRYRMIDRYEYPLCRCGAVLLGMVTSYLVYRALDHLHLHDAWLIGIAAIVWIVWAGVLFGPLVWRSVAHSRKDMVKNEQVLGEV